MLIGNVNERVALATPEEVSDLSSIGTTSAIHSAVRATKRPLHGFTEE
jgi:hypothetical protein